MYRDNPQNLKLKAQWAARFQPLVGRTIKAVRWMSAQESVNCGFDQAPIVLVLDDNTLLFPSRDDEGNDAGALFTQAGDLTPGLAEIAPVL